jgi:hypothetical protein
MAGSTTKPPFGTWANDSIARSMSAAESSTGDTGQPAAGEVDPPLGGHELGNRSMLSLRCKRQLPILKFPKIPYFISGDAVPTGMCGRGVSPVGAGGSGEVIDTCTCPIRRGRLGTSERWFG